MSVAGFYFNLNHADGFFDEGLIVETKFAFAAVLDDAGLNGVNGVVFAKQNIFAGHNFSAALAHDN